MKRWQLALAGAAPADVGQVSGRDAILGGTAGAASLYRHRRVPLLGMGFKAPVHLVRAQPGAEDSRPPSWTPRGGVGHSGWTKPMGQETTSYTSDMALARLVDGNQRFVNGEARFPTVRKEVLAALTKGQAPYATILGCSDSRVPPELVFDAGFGELFIVRIAGNVLSPEVAGTMQYAGAHLKTPLFVVLGHEGCGAVQAALDSKFASARHRSRIEVLLANIVPGLDGLDPGLPKDALLNAAVEANVRSTVGRIRETPEAQAREAEGVMKLVGAVFELSTGRVRFLD